MKKIFLIFTAVLAASVFGDARNASFNRLNGNPPVQATIDQARKAGLICPDAKDWPHFWQPNASKGKIEFPKNQFNGVSVKMEAPAGTFGYHGLTLTEDLTAEIYLRGHGVFSLTFRNYTKDDKRALFVAPAKGIKPIYIDIDSDVWVRYTFYLSRPANIWNMHPVLGAHRGTIECDELRIRHQKHAGSLAIAKAENRLRAEKRFVCNKASVAVDDAAKVSMEIFKKQSAALEKFVKANAGNAAGKDLAVMVESLTPYIFTDGIVNIKVDNWNRMNALSYAVEALTGNKAGFPAVAK